MTGLYTRPSETLLVERALDFLAAGPADAATLVSHVFQQPRTPPMLAERLVGALLDGQPDFAREADGRWRRRTRGEQEAAGLLPGEAGMRTPAARRRQPTYDEWVAARDAAAGDPLARVGEPAPAPRRARGGVARARAALEAAERAGDADALAGLTYAVVDVETTGGNPETGHRVTEVAAVIVRDGRVCEVFESLVNPERSIPPFISQITNITWAMVKDAPRFADVAPRLVDFLRGHVFVAHNVSFDWKFVSWEVARATGVRLDGRRLCTVKLARRLCPELPRRTLGHVAHHFDAITVAEAYFAEHHPDMIWRHRAAGDAVATAHCLTRLLARAHDRGAATWGELDMLIAGGTGRARARRAALSLPRPVDEDTTA